MLDATLHTGIEHPNLIWIGVSSLLSFGVGVLVGKHSDSTTSNTEQAVNAE